MCVSNTSAKLQVTIIFSHFSLSCDKRPLFCSYIFWVNSDSTPQIQRAGMDGEGHMPVVSTPDISFPTAIAVDNQESDGRIVVADQQRIIYSFNMEGKDKIVLAYPDKIPVGVAVDEDFIYWIGGDTFYRAEKHNGANKVALEKKFGTVADFKIAIPQDKGKEFISSLPWEKSV